MGSNSIGDYALIGDCHSAALVGRDGAIEWACLPRFDSPSIFCAVLDPGLGGSLSIEPEGIERVQREYLEDTNVLVTRFECAGGTLEVTDCMPVAKSDDPGSTQVQSFSSLLRKVRCITGEVSATLRLQARFEYGSFVPRYRAVGESTAEIVGGADALFVTATGPLQCREDEVVGDWVLRADETRWLNVEWYPSHDASPPAPSAEDMESMLDNAVDFWRDWMKECRYDGDHEALVRRSALVLKALTYSPSGAIVAAPTTSLPEELGGIRNWDYRYTWIRDATLTLTSLFVLGFADEADAFKTWLERTGAGRPEDLQIMYGICGERALPERTLDHLAGHRASAPVRVGNGAVKQMQLDAYGQILEAAYLYAKAGRPITEDNWSFISGLVDIVCSKWRDPDHGIWEMRDTPRHFVHSKLNCWIALDRGAKMARAAGTARPDWESEADAIRAYLMDHAERTGWIAQAVDNPVPDAAALLAPAAGFLETNHPLVQATMDRVRNDLESDGLVHRYLSDDGLVGGEGAFLLCSFWLVDCLTHSGRLDEAEDLLDRLLALANDVGLFAEEADVATGEALGNFPQAFTHMALVLSCAHLSAARQGIVPSEGAHSYAELAVERLMAARR